MKENNFLIRFGNVPAPQSQLGGFWLYQELPLKMSKCSEYEPPLNNNVFWSKLHAYPLLLQQKSAKQNLGYIKNCLWKWVILLIWANLGNKVFYDANCIYPLFLHKKELPNRNLFQNVSSLVNMSLNSFNSHLSDRFAYFSLLPLQLVKRLLKPATVDLGMLKLASCPLFMDSREMFV